MIHAALFADGEKDTVWITTQINFPRLYEPYGKKGSAMETANRRTLL